MKKIINIISGKGGTGKTLMTAVLADMLGNKGAKVLVVDLDVFVRGLTTLLYFQNNESIRIIGDDEKSVSDYFTGRHDKFPISNKKIAIHRYRSFDVIPSVGAVNELLNFHDIMPNNVEEAVKVLNQILSSVTQEYDFIFLDSRAGYDELIEATHRLSDFSICIEEDDEISMITSENVIEQLKRNSKEKQILRVTNKGRSGHVPKEKNSYGISFVGYIPFDADVMNSFGTKNFWDTIGHSIYKEFLIDIWNVITRKMELEYSLRSNRISPISNKRIEKNISMLSSSYRILFLYGVLLVILGLGIYIYSSGLYEIFRISAIEFISILSIIFGVILTTYSVFMNNRK